MKHSCDRRVFLGYAGSTAGALMVWGIAPLGMAGTSDAFSPGAWHVDDMWGHTPRYAHPIPHAWPQHVPLCLNSVEPIDWQWVG